MKVSLETFKKMRLIWLMKFKMFAKIAQAMPQTLTEEDVHGTTKTHSHVGFMTMTTSSLQKCVVLVKTLKYVKTAPVMRQTVVVMIVIGTQTTDSQAVAFMMMMTSSQARCAVPAPAFQYAKTLPVRRLTTVVMDVFGIGITKTYVVLLMTTTSMPLRCVALVMVKIHTVRTRRVVPLMSMEMGVTGTSSIQATVDCMITLSLEFIIQTILSPLKCAAPVWARLKKLIKRRFGVTF